MLLGFFKEIVIIRMLGVGFLSDSFIFITTLPFIIFSAVSGVILSILVPSYIKLEEKYSFKEANSFGYLVFYLVSAVFLFISITMYVFPDFILSVLAPGLHMNADLLISLKILSSSLVFFVYIYTFGAVLNAKSDNLINVMLQVPFHLSIIFLLTFSAHKDYISVYSIYIGLFCMFVITFLRKRKLNIKFTRPTKVSYMELKSSSYKFFPVVLGALSPSLITLSLNGFASKMESGSLTLINFANKVFLSSYSAIGYVLILLYYPIFSRLAVQKEKDNLGIKFSEGFKVAVQLTLPVVAIIIVFSNEISFILINILDIDVTYLNRLQTFLVMIIPSLLFITIKDLILRFLMAIDDIKIIAINGLVSVLTFFVSYLVFVNLFGDYILIFCITLVHLTGAIYLYIYLYIKYSSEYNLPKWNIKFMKSDCKSICISILLIFTVKYIYEYNLYFSIVVFVFFLIFWINDLKKIISEN